MMVLSRACVFFQARLMHRFFLSVCLSVMPMSAISFGGEDPSQKKAELIHETQSDLPSFINVVGYALAAGVCVALISHFFEKITKKTASPRRVWGDQRPGTRKQMGARLAHLIDPRKLIRNRVQEIEMVNIPLTPTSTSAGPFALGFGPSD